VEVTNKFGRRGPMSGNNSLFYIIRNNKSGIAKIAESIMFSFSKLDVPGWTVKQFQHEETDIKIYTIAPRAVYKSHSAPVDLICVVSKGSGELFLTDAEGNEMDLIQCKSGDAYFQGANTLHGFRNGSEVTELIYIENKRPR